jgi:hypothetical protein
MNNLTVFINQHGLQQEGQTTAAITNAAKQLNYKTEMVN